MLQSDAALVSVVRPAFILPFSKACPRAFFTHRLKEPSLSQARIIGASRMSLSAVLSLNPRIQSSFLRSIRTTCSKADIHDGDLNVSFNRKRPTTSYLI